MPGRQPAKKAATSAGRPKRLASVRARQKAILAEQENQQARKAFELQQTGMSLWEIADELKITPTEVKDSVGKAMETAATLIDLGAKQDLLRLQMASLDRLQYALWNQAMQGNIPAAREVRGIIGDRIKFLGLTVEEGEGEYTTVVIKGSSAEYVASLRLISEHDGQNDTNEDEEPKVVQGAVILPDAGTGDAS